jgi:hypothetical protein
LLSKLKWRLAGDTDCSHQLLKTIAAHILQNRHEYGPAADTLPLLKACQRGTHMNCWEALYIQTHHQQKLLISEQLINDTNPLFELASITLLHAHNNQFLYLPALGTTCIDTVSTYTV